MVDLSEEYIIEQFEFKLEDLDTYLETVKNAFMSIKSGEGGTILFDKDTFGIMFGSPHQRRDLFVRAIHKETGKVSVYRAF